MHATTTHCTVLPCTATLYKALRGITKDYKVLPRTTKYCKLRGATTTYYTVLQPTTKNDTVLQGTTRNCRALHSSHKILQRTTRYAHFTKYYKILQSPTRYCNVLHATRYYNVLHGTTRYCTYSCLHFFLATLTLHYAYSQLCSGSVTRSFPKLLTMCVFMPEMLRML